MLERLLSGAYFGEHALSADSVHENSVVASDKSEFLWISRSSFLSTLREDMEQKKGDLKRATQLLETSGAIRATIERAREYGAKARGNLDTFQDTPHKRALIEAIDFAVNRSY